MKQTDYVWKEGIFMELLDMMKHRRSARTYNGQPISDKDVEQILLAGLFSAKRTGSPSLGVYCGTG